MAFTRRLPVFFLPFFFMGPCADTFFPPGAISAGSQAGFMGLLLFSRTKTKAAAPWHMAKSRRLFAIKGACLFNPNLYTKVG